MAAGRVRPAESSVTVSMCSAKWKVDLSCHPGRESAEVVLPVNAPKVAAQ